MPASTSCDTGGEVDWNNDHISYLPRTRVGGSLGLIWRRTLPMDSQSSVSSELHGYYYYYYYYYFLWLCIFNIQFHKNKRYRELIILD